MLIRHISSIRSPAAYNGLYGFRPSYHRIPYAGCVNSFEGQMAVVSVLGPISNSLEGVKTFMKNVISREPWRYDALTIRKKWNEEEYSLVEHGGGRQLCFAILWDDGLIKPHPPIQRGLETTKEALIRAGHKGENFNCVFYFQVTKLIWVSDRLETVQTC